MTPRLLTPDELAAIWARGEAVSLTDRRKLRAHIDAQAVEIAQLQALVNFELARDEWKARR